jgi:hypothetical protein
VAHDARRVVRNSRQRGRHRRLPGAPPETTVGRRAADERSDGVLPSGGSHDDRVRDRSAGERPLTARATIVVPSNGISALGTSACIRSPRPAASTIATAPSTTRSYWRLANTILPGHGLDDVAHEHRRVRTDPLARVLDHHHRAVVEVADACPTRDPPSPVDRELVADADRQAERGREVVQARTGTPTASATFDRLWSVVTATRRAPWRAARARRRRLRRRPPRSVDLDAGARLSSPSASRPRRPRPRRAGPRSRRSSAAHAARPHARARRPRGTRSPPGPGSGPSMSALVSTTNIVSGVPAARASARSGRTAPHAWSADPVADVAEGHVRERDRGPGGERRKPEDGTESSAATASPAISPPAPPRSRPPDPPELLLHRPHGGGRLTPEHPPRTNPVAVPSTTETSVLPVVGAGSGWPP